MTATDKAELSMTSATIQKKDELSTTNIPVSSPTNTSYEMRDENSTCAEISVQSSQKAIEHDGTTNENTPLERDCASEEIEVTENTINLLGATNDKQQREYTTTFQEEKELTEAVAELTSAISNNPNLSKVQKEYFLELAADPEGNNGGSIASYNTSSSIQSLRKATDFIQEDIEDRERLRQMKKDLPAPKKSTRETTVHENLWKAHAQRIAPKPVLEHMIANDTHGSRRTSLPSKPSNVNGLQRHSSMPIHTTIREYTIDDIATPKKSNIKRSESNHRLTQGGGAAQMGLAMPGFDDDDDDEDEEDEDDDDGDDVLGYGDDSDMYQIDYPVGFHAARDEDDDGGSITDSLLTDDENFDNNSMLDSYYGHDGVQESKPDTTVLFSSDRMPSSLSSVIRRAGEDDGDPPVKDASTPKKIQPILRHSQFTNDESSIASGVRRSARRRHSRQTSCPSVLLSPEIRESSGSGFEIIAPGYHYDDASVADTESLSSYRPAAGVVAFRSGDSQFSYPSLHRCDADEEQSYLSLIKAGGDINFSSLRGRTSSCPDSSTIFSRGCVDDKSLRDSLTALDDVSVVSYKKVSFSNESVKTKDVYPEVEEDTQKEADSLCLSSEASAPNLPNFDDKVDVNHFLHASDDDDDNCSWSIATLEKDVQYDAWDVFKDDYVKDTIELPFEIFGTSAEDVSSMPHVMSPPLLESLRYFVPDRLFHNNFWMKYSLLRDGANLQILLRSIRGSNGVLLAIETTHGEVFGCYTTQPWKKTYGYFGTGECFVWKMKQTRGTKCHSLLDQVQLESEVEVFSFSNENDMFQVCKSDFMALGGGTISDASNLPDVNLNDFNKNVEGGFALALDEHLMNGTTSPCATFLSPCLTNSTSPTGEVFEVVNLEAWTFTPCSTEERAERNELDKMFRDGNTDIDVIGTYIGGRGY